MFDAVAYYTDTKVSVFPIALINEKGLREEKYVLKKIKKMLNTIAYKK